MARSFGLDDVIAGETDICCAGGHGDELLYRGYSISDLVEFSSYEEVAYLLIKGELPCGDELQNFRQSIKDNAELPDYLEQLLKIMPRNSDVMDVLRTSVSLLGQYESSKTSIVDSGISLLAKMPTIIASWQMIKNGLPKVSPSRELSFAGNILFLILGRMPEQSGVMAMDKSLILYAEHEYNASTFSARLVTSTLSDVYSAVSTAIGTLKGPLHGGANEKAMRMMNLLMTEENPEQWILNALKNKERIMGFGHRIYKDEDCRAKIIKEYFRELATRTDKSSLFELTQLIRDVMAREKNLYPNLDFYSAPLYFLLDIPIPLYTPLFVVSRMAGWISHIIEQRENNRLIRPRSRYTGPARREYFPIEKR